MVIGLTAIGLTLGLCGGGHAAGAEGHEAVSEHHQAREDGDGSKVNPLTVDPELAAFTAVVFVVLMLFLQKFAWKPLMEGFAKREKSIAAQIEEAAQSAQSASEALRRYEAKLAEAADQINEAMTAARRDAEAAKNRILAEAKAAAERRRDEALAEIEAARVAAQQQVAQRGASLGLSLASRILGRNLKARDHARLVKEFLEQ
jgi:F-type H+-transporting ATPase subunit b